MLEAVSYRDPAGFITLAGGKPLRYITHAYARQYDHLLQSGLYHRLVQEKLLVPHKEIAREKNGYYRVLEPERIPFISYPYEWTASQWQEVLLLQLRINGIAIEYGMILKDATPFNCCFAAGKALFIDTLSFDFYHPGEPWTAYRQFCETLLAPLALMHYKDPLWGRFITSSINGLALPFVSGQLPLRTRFNTTLLFHIHLHARFIKANPQPAANGNTLSKEKLLLLWQMLVRQANRWRPRLKAYSWLRYYENEIVSARYLNDKTDTISQWLQELKPGKVVDLGANKGHFSLLAAHHAQTVIALESDHDCLEALHQNIQQNNITNITTVWADLLQPSPAAGWQNEERAALLARLHNSDLVQMLALLHHLCIAANIPIPFVVKLLAQLTSGHAIVEFVPKSDQRVQQMLRNRTDIFPHYTEEDMMAAFENDFTLKAVHACKDSDRKLYLWEKKH